MSKYQQEKERARQKAIDWQYGFTDHNYSYGELADWAAYFERLAKRYGLIKEFRANAII